jgi:DNA invertase Pin-like site-specific DNA recombinase
MKRITKIEENKSPGRKKKLRVAAYCRVSTASDEQLVSLAAQKAHYENYIKSNDEWEFAGLYYDEGVTGTKKEKRDGLLSMVTDCERGKIDFVITKSISRFARNTTDCLELVRKLLDLNIAIFFEKENLNTGSMESELMLSILSSLAESESVSISENEKWGIKKRFQNGTFIISYPPYGYDNVDGEMVIVSEQAEIVKQIFADTLAGKSTHAIANELNAKGIQTKKGGKWTPGTINGIIGNEKYTGDVLYQKTYTDSRFNRHINYGEHDQYLVQNHHPAIISHEEYDRANAVLRQRGKEKGNGRDTEKYQNRYCFSGRIQCGECGGTWKRRIHYKPSGSYIAWCCANHLADKNSCSMKYITDSALKRAFVTMMNKLVFGHQKVLSPLLHSLRGMNDKAQLLKIQEMETQIEKNMERRQVLTNLMAGGYLEPALFNKESNALAAEAETLRQEKENLMHFLNGNMEKIDELQKLVRFVSGGTMLTAFEDEVFLSYVERVTVHSRMEVIFELKCGLFLKERLVD